MLQRYQCGYFRKKNANPKLRREEAADHLWVEDNTDLERRDFILSQSLPHTKHCPRYMGHMSLNPSNNPMMKFGLKKVTQTHVLFCFFKCEASVLF